MKIDPTKLQDWAFVFLGFSLAGIAFVVLILMAHLAVTTLTR